MIFLILMIGVTKSRRDGTLLTVGFSLRQQSNSLSSRAVPQGRHLSAGVSLRMEIGGYGYDREHDVSAG
jgi:hypothetical protein